MSSHDHGNCELCDELERVLAAKDAELAQARAEAGRLLATQNGLTPAGEHIARLEGELQIKIQLAADWQAKYLANRTALEQAEQKRINEYNKRMEQINLTGAAEQRLAAVEHPTIVCLCGSTRFKEAFDEAIYTETMAGRIVLSVGFYMHASGNRHGENVGATPEQKLALDELHKRKIDLADEVLILNVGGYVGASTQSELDYAITHGKRVRWLEDADALANLPAAPKAEPKTEPVTFLSQLRTCNKERCEQNFKHSISSWNIMEWGCALAGEAGELCNVLKKVKRQQDGIAGSRIDGDQTKAIADELADVIIYADLLAQHVGIDLAEAIASKFNETSLKVGYQKALFASPQPDEKADAERYRVFSAFTGIARRYMVADDPTTAVLTQRIDSARGADADDVVLGLEQERK